MPLFVVVMTNWQHRLNLQLPTLVPLALVDDNFSIFFDQARSYFNLDCSEFKFGWQVINPITVQHQTLLYEIL